MQSSYRIETFLPPIQFNSHMNVIYSAWTRRQNIPP